MPRNFLSFVYKLIKDNPLKSTSMIGGGAVSAIFLHDRQEDLNEKKRALIEEYKRKKHAADIIAPTITKKELVLPVIPTVDEAAMYKTNVFFDKEARKVEFKKQMVEKESEINIKNTMDKFLEKSVVGKGNNDLKNKS